MNAHVRVMHMHCVCHWLHFIIIIIEKKADDRQMTDDMILPDSYRILGRRRREVRAQRQTSLSRVHRDIQAGGFEWDSPPYHANEKLGFRERGSFPPTFPHASGLMPISNFDFPWLSFFSSLYRTIHLIIAFTMYITRALEGRLRKPSLSSRNLSEVS